VEKEWLNQKEREPKPIRQPGVSEKIFYSSSICILPLILCRRYLLLPINATSLSQHDAHHAYDN